MQKKCLRKSFCWGEFLTRWERANGDWELEDSMSTVPEPEQNTKEGTTQKETTTTKTKLVKERQTKKRNKNIKGDKTPLNFTGEIFQTKSQYRNSD